MYFFCGSGSGIDVGLGVYFDNVGLWFDFGWVVLDFDDENVG
jgi:hypothetical protein